MNPVSVKNLSRGRSLFTTWDFPLRIHIRWWEANTSAYIPRRTPTSCTLINPSSFTIPVRWDWQSTDSSRWACKCMQHFSNFSFRAGGGGESRFWAVPGVCQGSLSRMCATAWRGAVHPCPTLALCPIPGAQLLCELLVVVTAHPWWNKYIF